MVGIQELFIMSIYHKLSVKEIQKETENSVSIVFAIPQELKDKFKFIPGQYITIKKELNGEELRRAYSICSSVNSGEIRIGVKAVEKGLFSVYATTKLKVGDVLEVSVPEGRFNLNLNIAHKKTYLAFVAGSGITPVLSMVKSMLETEPNSKFVLVYGNKSANETMFKKQLENLQTTYPNQLFLQFVYSQYQEDGTLFGRIDSSVLNYILNNRFKELSFDEFFLCGPEAMINSIQSDLLEKSFSKDSIHYELFSAKTEEAIESIESLDGETTVTVILDDEEETFVMDKEKTILEAALKEGLDAPYSCQGGICSSCLAQVTKGKATMVQNSILSEDEVKDGLILTCQAHPITDKITIDFDNV